MKRFLSRNWLLILILLLATAARFYRLSATLTFLEDEGRDLLVAYRILNTGRPVLIGPQTSTGNMYLGPLYYYLITPVLWLAQMNPLGPAVFIALTGVLTVWLLYQIGSRWFGKSAGLLAAMMYAVFPLPVVFTRNSWNPNLAPFISLLIIWYLVKIVEEKSPPASSFFILGLLSGAIIQMHYMALLFLLSVAVMLSFSFRRRLFTLFQGALFALFGFIAILSPFFVFEFRNNFVNLRAITRFIRAKEEHNIRYQLPFSLWFDKIQLTTTRLFAGLFGRDALTLDPARTFIALTIAALIFAGFFFALRGKRSSARIYQFLFFIFIIPLALTGIYQENIHLHYLGFFFPLVYLLVAGSISLNRFFRWPASFVILVLIFLSGPQLFGYLHGEATNQVIRAREVAEYVIRRSRQQPYNLISASGTHTTPYLYFTAISSHPPTTTPTSLVFLVCQGRPCSSQDISSPFLFITGQAHPSISAYLGHPLFNYFEGPRTVISNEHVSHGAWVAELELEKASRP